MTWAGIIDGTIIGPYYFDENVSSRTYLEMLENFVIPELEMREFDLNQICYMHDGAPAHYTLEVRQFLTNHFQSWIGRGEGSLLAWPPRSPDLNMLDFYLWGELQHRVNLIENLTIAEVELKIIREIDAISPETLSNVHHNLFKRLRICIQENGGIFEHILKMRN